MNKLERLMHLLSLDEIRFKDDKNTKITKVSDVLIGRYQLKQSKVLSIYKIKNDEIVFYKYVDTYYRQNLCVPRHKFILIEVDKGYLYNVGYKRQPVSVCYNDTEMTVKDEINTIIDHGLIVDKEFCLVRRLSVEDEIQGDLDFKVFRLKLDGTLVEDINLDSKSRQDLIHCQLTSQTSKIYRRLYAGIYY